MNDFSRQDIETLKASVDLCELIRSHGIDLKPVGRNFTALCPWHDDKDASFVVNPEKQLYNCFGCEAKGDALSFLQAQEHLSFPQAVMRLKEIAGDTSPPPSSEPHLFPTRRHPEGARGDRFDDGHTRNDLLEKVCRHYQNGLESSEDARQYLKERKLWNSELHEGFRFGYCDGTLLKALPKGDVRDAMQVAWYLAHESEDLKQSLVKRSIPYFNEKEPYRIFDENARQGEDMNSRADDKSRVSIPLTVLWAAIALLSQGFNIANPHSIAQANQPWYSPFLVASAVFLSTICICLLGTRLMMTLRLIKSTTAVNSSLSAIALFWIVVLASLTTF